MSKKIVQTAGRDALGEFAPEFAHFNDDVLFGENWNNEDLDLKTRSLLTVTALMAQGITDSSLKYHIQNAKNHGVSQKEMAAAITHVAFYAGWPKAWATFNLAKEVYGEDGKEILGRLLYHGYNLQAPEPARKAMGRCFGRYTFRKINILSHLPSTHSVKCGRCLYRECRVF